MATAIQILVSERATPAVHAYSRPALSMLLIMIADVVGLSTAILVSAALRHRFGGDYDLGLYLHVWPTLVLFLAVYSLFGLYPGVIFNAVTEIKQVATATTVVYLILGVLTFMLRVSETYSRLVFLMAWLMSMSLVPLIRAVVRNRFGRQSWWGYPVLVLAGGGAESNILHKLKQQPELGFRVSAVLRDERDPDHTAALRHSWEMAPILASHYNISHAVVAVPGLPAKDLLELLDTYARPFSHLYIIPDLDGLSSLGIEARDFCHALALELRNRLLLPSSRLAKRFMDLLLTLIIGLAVLPLLLFIVILIKLDTKGPLLYGHLRIGRHGDRFKVWKFRTMVHNADHVLKGFLKRHPKLKREWERDHKLKNDPRVTRVGMFLRKTSLDELPQLWNVLKGEMSLVGPRPVVTAEIPEYGTRFNLYTQVLPGLTGLWQVSGRNDTTYTERVALDTYYVRNWSPWLDIYILARTVKVVFRCRGAY